MSPGTAETEFFAVSTWDIRQIFLFVLPLLANHYYLFLLYRDLYRTFYWMLFIQGDQEAIYCFFDHKRTSCVCYCNLRKQRTNFSLIYILCLEPIGKHKCFTLSLPDKISFCGPLTALRGPPKKRSPSRWSHFIVRAVSESWETGGTPPDGFALPKEPQPPAGTVVERAPDTHLRRVP